MNSKSKAFLLCCLFATLSLMGAGCAEVAAFSPFVQGVDSTTISPLDPPSSDPENSLPPETSLDQPPTEIGQTAEPANEEIIPAERLLKDLGQAAEFEELTWVNAEPVRLADLRGQVVVVEFWSYG